MYWRVDEERPEEPATPSDATADEGSADTPADPPTPSERRTEPLSKSVSDDTPDTLEDVDFPRGRDREECEAAVRAARDYIRENGGATMRELVAGVMPAHPVGYDTPEIEAGELVPDRYRGAWWRKVVRPGLKALDDVEKPLQGASEWKYTGSGEPDADDPPTSDGIYDPTEEF